MVLTLSTNIDQSADNTRLVYFLHYLHRLLIPPFLLARWTLKRNFSTKLFFGFNLTIVLSFFPNLGSRLWWSLERYIYKFYFLFFLVIHIGFEVILLKCPKFQTENWLTSGKGSMWKSLHAYLITYLSWDPKTYFTQDVLYKMNANVHRAL